MCYSAPRLDTRLDRTSPFIMADSYRSASILYIRPFLAGSKNMAAAGLPKGVFYDLGNGKGNDTNALHAQYIRSDVLAKG